MSGGPVCVLNCASHAITGMIAPRLSFDVWLDYALALTHLIRLSNFSREGRGLKIKKWEGGRNTRWMAPLRSAQRIIMIEIPD